MAWCESTNAETKTFLSSLQWGDLSGELVMDVGCGTGNMSTKCILERFPRVSKILAIDKDRHCIQECKDNFQKGIFKKATFHCASITDWVELQQWEGKISKIVSAHCISWVKRQQLAFEHMFKLLKHDGQAAILFVLRSESDDAYLEMAKKPKWAEYFNCLNTKRVLKLRGFDNAHYRKMLSEIGFLVPFCREREIVYAFQDDEEFKDGIWDSALLKNVPRELHDEFVEEIFTTFLSIHPRNEAGNLNYKHVMIEALVKKVEAEESS